MTAILFLFVLAAAFISLVVCILRLLACIGANSYKHDSGTKYRNKKYRNVGVNFVVTIVLFVIAAKLACIGLGF